jgi:riboflavin synthase
MFTGIVTHRGRFMSRTDHGGDQRLLIEAGTDIMRESGVGDSIAVNGVCLTMIEPAEDHFHADVSVETLEKTTLGSLLHGAKVNLELPVRLSDRLGGHMVSGHVDGRARLISRQPDVRSERFEFEAPADLGRYISTKGSVTLDGVSLTVNSVDGNRFSVNLIPHTLEVTSLGDLEPGGAVNIEVDMIARYLERLVQGTDGWH